MKWVLIAPPLKGFVRMLEYELLNDIIMDHPDIQIATNELLYIHRLNHVSNIYFILFERAKNKGSTRTIS